MDFRTAKDRIATRFFFILTIGCCLLVVALAAGLYWKSRPLLAIQPISGILFSSDWAPGNGHFGLLAFLAGTVYVTVLAMLICVPVSILTAIYLAEYAPRQLRYMILPLMDLLSGIPSVIFGIFGVLVIVPAIGRLALCFGIYSSGYCLLSGSIVLAIMACPFIINVSHEVLAGVPDGVREASLALGATRWQTVKYVVLRKARPGVLAAIMLGFARAIGETIAVLMVVGNIATIPRSLFDPAYPLPALLANNYGEMMSIPHYDAALMLSALVLLVIVLCFNLLAKATLIMIRSDAA